MAKQLMLVDDDEVFHRVVNRCCRKLSGAEMLVGALDGAQGLAILEELAEKSETLPDVILVDVNMPVLDGFGFLRGLSELRDRYAALAAVKPVAMLTSSDQERDRALALELGADHYMIKGDSMDEVRSSIAGCLA